MSKSFHEKTNLSLFVQYGSEHVMNVRFLVSDTGFSGKISVFWRAGKIFSCPPPDLNLS